MVAKTRLLLLLISVFHHANAHKPACVDILAELRAVGIQEDFHAGNPVSSKQINKALGFLKLADDTSVFFLGKGGAAAVYRIVPKSGSPYLIKKYHDDDGIGDGEEARAMATDNEAMERLRNMKSKPGRRIAVAVQTKQFLEHHATQYEDVRGFTLDVVAEALKGNDRKRTTVTSDYNRRLRLWINELKENGVIREARKREPTSDGFDSYSVEWSWAPPGFEGDLGTSKNVIFDPTTHRFTLIDPG